MKRIKKLVKTALAVFCLAFPMAATAKDPPKKPDKTEEKKPEKKEPKKEPQPGRGHEDTTLEPANPYPG